MLQYRYGYYRCSIHAGVYGTGDERALRVDILGKVYPEGPAVTPTPMPYGILYRMD
jgi:hypothetical protein